MISRQVPGELLVLVAIFAMLSAYLYHPDQTLSNALIGLIGVFGGVITGRPKNTVNAPGDDTTVNVSSDDAEH
jgi:hypothetical protein